MAKNYGKIILLNGTSSSGKSALVQAFSELLPACVVFKVDDWYPAVMHAKAQELGWKKNSGDDPWLYLLDYVDRQTSKVNFSTQVRAYLFPDIPEIYGDIKGMLERGTDVIFDTVFEYDSEYEKFTSFFDGFVVYKVLVYCSPEILVERVKLRNLGGNQEEKRTTFQSFEQFPAIYKLQENKSEKIIDEISAHVMKQALFDAIEELIAAQIPKKYLPRVEQFKQSFIEQFKLDEQEVVKIVARHAYDLILNSGTKTPKELAAYLFEHMRDAI